MITRDEHLQWCKQQALRETTVKDMAMSLMSDFDKHPETKLESFFVMASIPIFETWPVEKMRNFIKNLSL